MARVRINLGSSPVVSALRRSNARCNHYQPDPRNFHRGKAIKRGVQSVSEGHSTLEYVAFFGSSSPGVELIESVTAGATGLALRQTKRAASFPGGPTLCHQLSLFLETLILELSRLTAANAARWVEKAQPRIEALFPSTVSEGGAAVSTHDNAVRTIDLVGK